MNIINIKQYTVELNQSEFNTILFCMNYCYHRLEKHENSGLHGKVNLDLVDKLRKQMGEKV